MMTVYFKVIATIVMITGLFGFVIPTLVSASSTIAVLLGFLLLVLTPVCLYYTWEKELNKMSISILKD